MIENAAAIAASPAIALPSTKPVRRPIRRMMLEAGYVHRPRPTTFNAIGRVAKAGSGASTSPDSPPTRTSIGTAVRLSMVAMLRMARLARDVLRSVNAAGFRITRWIAYCQQKHQPFDIAAIIWISMSNSGAARSAVTVNRGGGRCSSKNSR